MSHPVWVRGLKQYEIGKEYEMDGVAPRVGAWIETIVSVASNRADCSRTPCGCVD